MQSQSKLWLLSSEHGRRMLVMSVTGVSLTCVHSKDRYGLRNGYQVGTDAFECTLLTYPPTPEFIFIVHRI